MCNSVYKLSVSLWCTFERHQRRMNVNNNKNSILTAKWKVLMVLGRDDDIRDICKNHVLRAWLTRLSLIWIRPECRFELGAFSTAQNISIKEVARLWSLQLSTVNVHRVRRMRKKKNNSFCKIRMCSRERNRNIGEGELPVDDMCNCMESNFFSRFFSILPARRFQWISFLWSGERLNIVEDSTFLSTNIFFYRFIISTSHTDKVMECGMRNSIVSHVRLLKFLIGRI